MTDKKKEATQKLLNEFRFLMLSTFDNLKDTSGIDRKVLADAVGEIGKYFMKQAIALDLDVDADTLKDRDFIIAPYAMVQAIKELVRGFDDQAAYHKKEAH